MVRVRRGWVDLWEEVESGIFWCSSDSLRPACRWTGIGLEIEVVLEDLCCDSMILESGDDGGGLVGLETLSSGAVVLVLPE